MRLLFIAVLASLASCEKLPGLSHTDSKVVGTWKYHEVRYRDYQSLWKSDSTSNYVNLTLSFAADHTVTATNSLTGETASGTWETGVTAYYDYYCKDNCRTRYKRHLRFWLPDNVSGEIQEHWWDHLQTSRHSLSGRQYGDTGTYFYYLIEN